MPSFHQNMNYLKLIEVDVKFVHMKALSLKDYTGLRKENSKYTPSFPSS